MLCVYALYFQISATYTTFSCLGFFFWIPFIFPFYILHFKCILKSNKLSAHYFQNVIEKSMTPPLANQSNPKVKCMLLALNIFKLFPTLSYFSIRCGKLQKRKVSEISQSQSTEWTLFIRTTRRNQLRIIFMYLKSNFKVIAVKTLFLERFSP